VEVFAHASIRASGDDLRDGAHWLRILIVDDNRDAAETLVTYLELEGHSVKVDYWGLAAIDTT
jgi:PleD family two-component response regulator